MDRLVRIGFDPFRRSGRPRRRLARLLCWCPCMAKFRRALRRRSPLRPPVCCSSPPVLRSSPFLLVRGCHVTVHITFLLLLIIYILIDLFHPPPLRQRPHALFLQPRALRRSKVSILCQCRRRRRLEGQAARGALGTFPYGRGRGASFSGSSGALWREGGPGRRAGGRRRGSRVLFPGTRPLGRRSATRHSRLSRLRVAVPLRVSTRSGSRIPTAFVSMPAWRCAPFSCPRSVGHVQQVVVASRRCCWLNRGTRMRARGRRMQLVWDFCRARRRGGLDDGGQAVEFVLLVVVRVYGPVAGSRLAAEMSRCGVAASGRQRRAMSRQRRRRRRRALDARHL